MTLSSNRPNEIMKTPALRKSKYYVNTGSFQYHNNCGSTHPSKAASKENKLPPPFSGFKSKTKSPWIQLWWGLRNKKWRTVVKQLSNCLSSLAARSVLLISKRQYTSCTGRPPSVSGSRCWLKLNNNLLSFIEEIHMNNTVAIICSKKQNLRQIFQ